MKKLLFLNLAISAFLTHAQSSLKPQIYTPVKWSTSSQQISKDEFLLQFKVEIDDGWYVYSSNPIEDEFGPVPTSFTYDEGNHFELIGEIEENGPKKISGFDKIFEINLTKYAKQISFSQKVRVKDFSKSITGYLEYMTCDDTKCLAPTDEDFKFELTESDAFSSSAQSEFDTKKKSGSKKTDRVKPHPSKEEFDYSEQTVESSLLDSLSSESEVLANESRFYGIPGFDVNTEPIAECGDPLVTTQTNWGIFLLGFLGGLIALLTPCVFPMIPLTVSFFTKSDESKKKGLGKAALYGFFITLVYVVLSLPFHLIDNLNPDILNELSTNVFLNILFFVVFLVFAFSFFGYYELTLPSSWVNKSSQAESLGGVLGIFFMALTLALVSFSCTGPILGSLLAGSITPNGGAIQLTMGMTGFGLALGLPFAFFAAFPGWMKNLPKSGGWMGNLKVALGFIELALALKFLSNADLVKHWGILKIEVFLGIWILIFSGMAVFFLKKIKWRKGYTAILTPNAGTVGLLSLAFVIYLMTGFQVDDRTGTYKPLTWLSGLAPTVGYSLFNPVDCPQNLDCYKDLESGLAVARDQNKPVMIDFTGYACVNCREMEENVWPKQIVRDQLDKEIVLISLYVDDKTELPADQKIEVERPGGGKRKLRTVGHKWAHFQTEAFQINSQPYYVLMSPDGQVLNHPVAYTPNVEEYSEFLACGINAFKELKD